MTVVALAAALVSTYRVSLFPPNVESKSLEYASASSQLLIQPADPGALDAVTTTDVVSPTKAALYASLLRSQPVRRKTGAEAGLPWQAIAIQGQTGSANTSQPDAPQRSAQLVSQGGGVALFFSLAGEVPIVNLYAQAPNVALATRVVSGATNSLRQYVNNLQTANEVPASQRVEIVKLGEPEAGMLATGANMTIGVLVGLFVFGIGCLLILFVPRFVVVWRKAAALENDPTALSVPAIHTPESLNNGHGSAHEIAHAHRELSGGE